MVCDIPKAFWVAFLYLEIMLHDVENMQFADLICRKNLSETLSAHQHVLVSEKFFETLLSLETAWSQRRL